MLPVVCAALSAFVWGAADYCGGRATVRVSALPVTVADQAVGLALLAALVPLLPGRPYASDLGWGGLAGLAGFGGGLLLYRALASGAMAVVAPISAVTAALVPLGVGLLSEARPTPIALAGAGLAVVAIAMVSLGPGDRSRDRSVRAGVSAVGMALGAGAFFGLFFVVLAHTHADSGVWPLLAARLVALPAGLVVLRAARATVRMAPAVWRWAAVIAVGDVGANALYLVAVRGGLLSVIGPISALYPVSTVLLALVLDKERVRPIQVAGLGLAVTALVLTAV